MLSDLVTFMRAELSIALVLFLLVFIKVGTGRWPKRKILLLVNLLLAANFASGFFFHAEGTLFGGMFETTHLIGLEKNILNGGVLLISLQAYSWLAVHQHAEEFYILLLSTLLGMFFMISAGNLLMFYLALELSTIPLAALANFDLEKRASSEAALKFIISSAFSSGLLLFGISLMYGTTGTFDLAGISRQLDGSPLQLLAFILLLTGFAFKISVVPFHLWTADVYEGSPVAVTAYLSVISKGAMLFVLIPILYTVFKPISDSWYRILFLLSILTMVIGNLFAIRQQNMKRLLAFSSIAQVGFILVGLSGSSQIGSASVVYFVLAYLLSNLGAFGVVGVIATLAGKETIGTYKGLYRNNPMLAWALAISLFSLAGIPPTVGFFGKFFLLMAGAGKANYTLVTIAALNMIVSLYYYLRVVQAIFADNAEDPMEKLSLPWLPKIGILLCVIAILVTGLAAPVYEYIYSLSTTF
jgi:NADH-quinone oxidoreductase subunit N